MCKRHTARTVTARSYATMPQDKEPRSQKITYLHLHPPFPASPLRRRCHASVSECRHSHHYHHSFTSPTVPPPPPSPRPRAVFLRPPKLRKVRGGGGFGCKRGVVDKVVKWGSGLGFVCSETRTHNGRQWEPKAQNVGATGAPVGSTHTLKRSQFGLPKNWLPTLLTEMLPPITAQIPFARA